RGRGARGGGQDGRYHLFLRELLQAGGGGDRRAQAARLCRGAVLSDGGDGQGGDGRAAIRPEQVHQRGHADVPGHDEGGAETKIGDGGEPARWFSGRTRLEWGRQATGVDGA